MPVHSDITAITGAIKYN